MSYVAPALPQSFGVNCVQVTTSQQEHQTTTPHQRARWNERAVAWLDKVDQRMEVVFLSCQFQQRVDALLSWTNKLFSKDTVFNTWLNDNGCGTWYLQLAICLAKLPLRTARNILSMVHEIITSIIATCNHPSRSLTNLARLILRLIDELQHPETWSRIGAGTMGSTLGFACSTGSPLALMGFGIGGAMVIAGMTFGLLQKALEEECDPQKVVYAYLLQESFQLSETLLTGFVTGALIGFVQNTIQKLQASTFRVTAIDDTARGYVDNFLQDHDLPPYSRITLGPRGELHLSWENYELRDLLNRHPEFIKIGRIGNGIDVFSVSIHPDSSYVSTYDGWGERPIQYTFQQFGWHPGGYPFPPVNKTLEQIMDPAMGGISGLERKV